MRIVTLDTAFTIVEWCPSLPSSVLYPPRTVHTLSMGWDDSQLDKHFWPNPTHTGRMRHPHGQSTLYNLTKSCLCIPSHPVWDRAGQSNGQSMLYHFKSNVYVFCPILCETVHTLTVHAVPLHKSCVPSHPVWDRSHGQTYCREQLAHAHAWWKTCCTISPDICMSLAVLSCPTWEGTEQCFACVCRRVTQMHM